MNLFLTPALPNGRYPGLCRRKTSTPGNKDSNLTGGLRSVLGDPLYDRSTRRRTCLTLSSNLTTCFGRHLMTRTCLHMCRESAGRPSPCSGQTDSSGQTRPSRTLHVTYWQLRRYEKKNHFPREFLCRLRRPTLPRYDENLCLPRNLFYRYSSKPWELEDFPRYRFCRPSDSGSHRPTHFRTLTKKEGGTWQKRTSPLWRPPRLPCRGGSKGPPPDVESRRRSLRYSSPALGDVRSYRGSSSQGRRSDDTLLDNELPGRDRFISLRFNKTQKHGPWDLPRPMSPSGNCGSLRNFTRCQ